MQPWYKFLLAVILDESLSRGTVLSEVFNNCNISLHSTCFMIMSSIITESNLNAVITYLNVEALDFNTVRQILEEQLR